MATIGYKALVDPGVMVAQDATDNDQRATSWNMALTALTPGWVTAIGAWIDSTDEPATGYFALWATGETGVPGVLLGRTGLMTFSSGAANNEGSIESSETEVDTAIRVSAGQVLSLGIKMQGGAVLLGYSPVTNVNIRSWVRDVGPSLPTNPFNSATFELTNRQAIYAEFTDNSPPNVPDNITPADAVSGIATISFSGDFSDPDTIAPLFDALSAIEFEVLDDVTLGLFWGGPTAVLAATEDEKSTGHFEREYGGTSLTQGQVVRWRVRTWDTCGEPGAWSAYRTYTVSMGPSVVLSLPTGKVDGPTEEIAFGGTYNHTGAVAAEAFQVRVKLNGAVYRESPIILKAVLAGQSFTIMGEETGLGEIGSGAAFTAQARAYDGTDWGGWSQEIAFRTNAIPTTPTNLQPPDGSVATDYPILTFQSTDADADDVPGVGLTWEVEITWPDTTTHIVEVPNYDAQRGEALLESDNTMFPVYGEYEWRARSQDVSASDGYSEWSEPNGFTLQAGIIVTIVEPDEYEEMTTTTPAIDAVISSGTPVLRRLWIYPVNSESAIYDSGVEASATLLFLVPSAILENTESYDAVVWVQNDVGQEGYSLRRQFSINYIAPEPISGARLSSYAFVDDPSDTGVLFQWDVTELPLSEFGGYLITRRFVGEPESEAVKLKIITNPAQAQWLDPHAPANRPLIYTATVLKRIAGPSPSQGTQTVASASVQGQIEVRFAFVILSSTTDPSRRVLLRWKPATRRGTFEQEQTTFKTWGGQFPLVFFGRSPTQRIIDASFTIIGDEIATRERHYLNGEQLYMRKETILYRDDRTRFFGVIRRFEYEQFDFKDTVRVRIEQTGFAEGI